MATLIIVWSPQDCADLKERLEKALTTGEPVEENDEE